MEWSIQVQQRLGESATATWSKAGASRFVRKRNTIGYRLIQQAPALKVTSLSKLRRSPGRIIDEAVDDHEPVLITRDRGKPAAVLMSLEDFSSYEETAFLLRSPANARRLLAGVAELDAGGSVERKLIE